MATRCEAFVNATGTQAYICQSCAANEICAVCSKQVGAIPYKAQLCADCGFGANAGTHLS
jgi:DNA-directed RNA polymerase subunit RPC12/RpoP